MGFVANFNFICFPAVQKIENRLRFDKVTESAKVGTFFETQCRLPKLRFVADSVDLAAVNLTQLALKAVVLCEITLNH